MGWSALALRAARKQVGKSIAATLREAQRWLREDIVSGPYLQQQVLPGFLAKLDDPDHRRWCGASADRYARRYPDRPPFASPVHWAAFTATGLAYPLEKKPRRDADERG